MLWCCMWCGMQCCIWWCIAICGAALLYAVLYCYICSATLLYVVLHYCMHCCIVICGAVRRYSNCHCMLYCVLQENLRAIQARDRALARAQKHADDRLRQEITDAGGNPSEEMIKKRSLERYEREKQ